MQGKGGSKKGRKSLQTILQIWHLWKERGKRESLRGKNVTPQHSSLRNVQPGWWGSAWVPCVAGMGLPLFPNMLSHCLEAAWSKHSGSQGTISKLCPQQPEIWVAHFHCCHLWDQNNFDCYLAQIIEDLLPLGIGSPGFECNLGRDILKGDNFRLVEFQQGHWGQLSRLCTTRGHWDLGHRLLSRLHALGRAALPREVALSHLYKLVLKSGSQGICCKFDCLDYRTTLLERGASIYIYSMETYTTLL